MKRKIFAAALALALTATALAGCSLEFNFNSGDGIFAGNYKEATPEQKSEVEQKIEKLIQLEEQAIDSHEAAISNMRLDAKVSGSSQGVSMTATTTDLYDYHDLDSIKLSETIETKATYNGETREYVLKLSADTANPVLYISYDAKGSMIEQKSEKGTMTLYSQSIEAFRSMFNNSGNTKLTLSSVLESMKLVEAEVYIDSNKVKITNVKDIVQGYDMDVEYYVVFENDNSYSCKKVFKYNLEGIEFTGDVVLTPTTENVTLPADLESYTKSFSSNELYLMIAASY